MKISLFAVVIMLITTMAACSDTSTSSHGNPRVNPGNQAAPSMKPTDADLSVKFVAIDGSSITGNGITSLIMKFQFTNVGNKNIKAIQGNIWAYDRFGVSLGSLEGVDIEEGIPVGKSSSSTERWPHIDGRLENLLGKYPQGPIFKWETTKVVYE